MLNINLYEGVLRISKAKLYKSPYRKSVDQVWEVIKKLKPKNRVNFLKNLIDVEIEVVDKQEIEKKQYNARALYESNSNKIYLMKDSNSLKNDLNHEFFHMSSRRRKNKTIGISISNVFGSSGKYLDEGITEYLNLKSQNIKTSDSGYQVEVFVIEMLIFMFGEQILEPYFNNDSIAFLEQFKILNVPSSMILKLDNKLKKMACNDDVNNYRSSCLILSDIYSDVVDEDVEFFRKIKLDLKFYKIFEDFFTKYQAKLKEEIDNTIISLDYQFKDMKKKKVFDEYEDEFQKSQREIFSQILDLLFEITAIRKISFNDVYKFMQMNLFYKDNKFKELYTNIISEQLKLPIKKR